MSKQLRIILADDHPSVRFGVRGIVESQADWKVVAETGDGALVVALCEEHEPDVLILDLNLPGLGGAEITKRLRTAIPTVAVLILTMHAAGDVVAEALAAGARGYLLKTDSPRVIQAAIEAVADGRAFYTQSVALLVESSSMGQHLPISGLHARLTPREREVVKLLAEGHTNKDVAQRLGISVKTADVHRTNIMRRLNLHAVAELVRYAIRERIIEP